MSGDDVENGDIKLVNASNIQTVTAQSGLFNQVIISHPPAPTSHLETTSFERSETAPLMLTSAPVDVYMLTTNTSIFRKVCHIYNNNNSISYQLLLKIVYIRGSTAQCSLVQPRESEETMTLIIPIHLKV